MRLSAIALQDLLSKDVKHNVHFGCSNCIQEEDYIEYQVTFHGFQKSMQH